MTRLPMTPEVAQEILRINRNLPQGHRHALETIAAMSVEECGRVLTMKETGGRHKVRTTYRLVSDWHDTTLAPPQQGGAHSIKEDE